jgi:hypothetical protein
VFEPFSSGPLTCGPRASGERRSFSTEGTRQPPCREEALERGSQAFELAEAQQAPRMLLAEIQANLERFEAALDTQAE